MENHLKEVLNATLIIFFIFVVFVIGLEALTLANIDELKNEIRDMKREHHVIIEYKEIPKDTIKIITPEQMVGTRYGLKW